MKLVLSAGERTRVADVVRRGDRVRVAFDDGTEAEVRLLSDGGGRFELRYGHARIHAAGVVRGLGRQLWVNGRTFTYHCEGRRATREDPQQRSLTSPLPAVVLEVLVTEGDAVKAGQKLVLLESMKTVLAIQAPRDGVVKSVRCSPGEAIQAEVPLLEME